MMASQESLYSVLGDQLVTIKDKVGAGMVHS